MKAFAWRLAIAGWIGFAGAAIARAQTPSTVMQLRTFQGTSLFMAYHLFKPNGFSPAQRYPLILTFHGVGENGDTTNTDYINKNGVVSAWVAAAFQAKHPCFVFSPHLREPNQTWIDTPWTVSNTSAKYKQGPISKRLTTVLQILDSLTREFPIDTNRIYVTGLSIGGWATWDLVTRFPERFAAAFPQSGGVDTGKAQMIAKTPIWSYHGAKDNTVTPLSENLLFENLDKLDGDKGVVYPWCHGTSCPAKMGAAKLDSLAGAGMIHFYTLDPNQGHDGWDKYYADPTTQEWMMKQNRAAATGIRKRRPAAGSSATGGKAILHVPGGIHRPDPRAESPVFGIQGRRIPGAEGAPRNAALAGGVLFRPARGDR